ncbi:MAG: phosphatase [bacterium]|nr:MAG: phosphatase [bacterium]
MGKQIIIWDWNGTLLNDVQMCVNCINVLLEKRNLTRLSLETYRSVFSFPVRDYYEQIGFDFVREDFEVPAKEFMDLYHRFLPETSLFSCAGKVLAYFKRKGYSQLVLSAMEHNSLIKTLEEKGILDYFDAVSGIDNIYAGSKQEMARAFLDSLGLNNHNMVLVGDTLHDREVALALGIDYLLVAAGHQSKSRLLEKTDKVVDMLSEVVENL